jgi:hypothetical protein
MLVTFAVLFAALTVALFAVGVFAQGALYETVARRMPVRAVVGGLILAAFLTLWTYVNTRATTKDKYGTLFEFNSTSLTSYDTFDAVRVRGTPKAGTQLPEEKVTFKREADGKTTEAADPSRKFALTTTDQMTIALEIPEGGEKTRFDAELGPDGKYKSGSNKVFRDKKGRFIEFGQSNVPG